ncbi:MAG: DCC1-like thiol-disulfide oxidoreductase family protein [Bacteroidota bacterium]
METSANKAILYDDNCPMCALYTKGFVQWGVLQPENRIAFTQADQQLTPAVLAYQLDPLRARHEIPLVDLTGGPTLYGLDAMVFLLGQRIPLISKMMRLRPLHCFFRFLYSLISYNRRIIIPSQQAPAACDCTPAFHLGYRLAFIAYALVLASLITYLFGWSVAGYWPMENSGGKMLFICGTGWVIQMLWAVILLSEKKVDYLGHLAVLMILGTLILVPGITLSWLTHNEFPFIPVVSVLVSSSLMGWQHVRRVQHLGLSKWWTASWFITLQSTAAVWVYSFFLP